MSDPCFHIGNIILGIHQYVVIKKGLNIFTKDGWKILFTKGN